MTTVKLLRVVTASPSDVKGERETLTKEVIRRVNRLIAEDLVLILQAEGWETDSYPGLHVEDPQGLIDTALDIEDCDILICIFWRRFGTPIKQGGETGTKHEFYKAYNAWTKNKRPYIMLYFKTQSYSPRTSGELKQHEAVLEFKENLPQEDI